METFEQIECGINLALSSNRSSRALRSLFMFILTLVSFALSFGFLAQVCGLSEHFERGQEPMQVKFAHLNVILTAILIMCIIGTTTRIITIHICIMIIIVGKDIATLLALLILEPKCGYFGIKCNNENNKGLLEYDQLFVLFFCSFICSVLTMMLVLSDYAESAGYSKITDTDKEAPRLFNMEDGTQRL